MIRRQRRNYICLQTSTTLKSSSTLNSSSMSLLHFTNHGRINHSQSVVARGHKSNLLLGDVGLAVDASVTRARADLLRLNIVVISASVLVADGLDTAGLDVGESGSVAQVRVDAFPHVSKISIVMKGRMRSALTSKSLALRSSDVVKDDMALVLGLAVAAAAVEFAEVVNGEAADGKGSATVVLQDLVCDLLARLP